MQTGHKFIELFPNRLVDSNFSPLLGKTLKDNTSKGAILYSSCTDEIGNWHIGNVCRV